MKKRCILLLIALVLLIPSSFSQNRSIVFLEKPWSEIVSIAKDQNKLIFLDAFASWCGPCKWMGTHMFTNDTVADYYNQNFICAHLDMEKGEGPELSAKYQVRAYPTLLFINGNGELIHKQVGAPQHVLNYIEMGKVALTPGQGFTAYIKQYETGNRDPKFMFGYFERLQNAYIPIRIPLQEYFASQPEDALMNPFNWNIFFRYTQDMDSKEFKYLLKNMHTFEKIHGVDSVNSKIFMVFSQVLSGLSRSKSFTEDNYKALKQKIRDTGYPEVEKIFFTSDLSLYQSQGDISKYLTLAIKDLDKYYGMDYSMLNQVAWNFFQISTDQKQLEKAAEWAKKSIEINSIPENNDTYANLMFKSGNKKEAEKYESAAIKLAKKARIETKEYEENLKKFQGN
ncbi:MAG: thioredoxin family protein [Bacteroidales bacterium]|nr:thioredoxin family protein [Bacteroidales bacterium]